MKEKDSSRRLRNAIPWAKRGTKALKGYRMKYNKETGKMEEWDGTPTESVSAAIHVFQPGYNESAGVYCESKKQMKTYMKERNLSFVE